MTASTAVIRTSGSKFLGPDGEPLLLRGVCLGGWLNMENFITGYAANETLMRREVRKVIGDDRAERFFDRLLTQFFDEPDAAFLEQSGLNLARIAVGYKHLEDDARPFEIKGDGFRHLDRAIETLGRHGVYSIVDLHALPGSQNQHWHSDNPTHIAAFWEHRHFQDRVVHLWEAIADHYRGNPWVAGYNLLNEPADESRSVVGPFYRRLVTAIRAVDPDHAVFLDGNTYATEFDVFAEPFDNAVYTLHDYVPAGLGRSPHYSREEAEQKFLQRSAYARSTGTPILVGEFGPIYTGDEAKDARAPGHPRRPARPLPAAFGQLGAVDVQGHRPPGPGLGAAGHALSAPVRRLRGQEEPARRRPVGQRRDRAAEVTQPVQDLIAREFPDFDPYPWGRFDWVRTLLLNITFSQPLAHDYASRFAGLDDSELDALADSFAFASCAVREPLLAELQRSLASRGRRGEGGRAARDRRAATWRTSSSTSRGPARSWSGSRPPGSATATCTT